MERATRRLLVTNRLIQGTTGTVFALLVLTQSASAADPSGSPNVSTADVQLATDSSSGDKNAVAHAYEVQAPSVDGQIQKVVGKQFASRARRSSSSAKTSSTASTNQTASPTPSSSGGGLLGRLFGGSNKSSDSVASKTKSRNAVPVPSDEEVSWDGIPYHSVGSSKRSSSQRSGTITRSTTSSRVATAAPKSTRIIRGGSSRVTQVPTASRSTTARSLTQVPKPAPSTSSGSVPKPPVDSTAARSSTKQLSSSSSSRRPRTSSSVTPKKMTRSDVATIYGTGSPRTNSYVDEDVADLVPKVSRRRISKDAAPKTNQQANQPSDKQTAQSSVAKSTPKSAVSSKPATPIATNAQPAKTKEQPAPSVARRTVPKKTPSANVAKNTGPSVAPEPTTTPAADVPATSLETPDRVAAVGNKPGYTVPVDPAAGTPNGALPASVPTFAPKKTDAIAASSSRRSSTPTNFAAQPYAASGGLPPTPAPAARSAAPVTQTPISQTPIAQTPVSQAPVSQTPVSQAPVSQAPVSQTPATSFAPRSGQPSTAFGPIQQPPSQYTGRQALPNAAASGNPNNVSMETPSPSLAANSPAAQPVGSGVAQYPSASQYDTNASRFSALSAPTSTPSRGSGFGLPQRNTDPYLADGFANAGSVQPRSAPDHRIAATRPAHETTTTFPQQDKLTGQSSRFGNATVTAPDSFAANSNSASGVSKLSNLPANVVSSELPGIRVVTNGPSSVMIRQSNQYEIRVENRGAIDAKGVLVRALIPDWAEIKGKQASIGDLRSTGEQDDERLVWTIDQLPAGSSERLVIDLMAARSGTYNLDVDWTLQPQRSVAQVRVHEPQLDLMIEGPDQVVYGDSQTYRVRVLNPGDGIAPNVVFTLSPNSATPQTQRIGDIPAGKEAQFEVELTAQDLGDLKIHGLASGDLNLRAEGNKTIRVAAAKLEAMLNGPELKYQNTPANYRVQIENLGDATSENVVANLKIPVGVKYLGGIEGASLQKDMLRWEVKTMPPGSSREYQFNCTMAATGEHLFALDCQGTAAGRAGVSLATRVESIADLVLTISDPPAPAPIGSEVTYEIVLRNRGSRDAKEVVASAEFGHGIEPQRIEGQSGQVLTGKVVFDAIPRVGAGEEVRLQVIAVADRAGNHRFRTEVLSGETILVAEEATHYMSPRADRVSRRSSDNDLSR